MQVSVESLQGLQRKITIQVPGSEIENKYQNKLAEVAKSIKIDGFRPGKVPVSVVKERYGPGIRQDVISDVISKALPKAFEQESLHPAGMPSIVPDSVKEDENFEFAATFEVFPDIQLNEYNVDIEKIQSSIKDQDIEDMLLKVRRQHATWEAADKAAEKGDLVDIDFEGFMDDKPFEGGKAEGYTLELGSASMIPGFEEGIIGAKTGEDVTLDIAFPEGYHATELAGKPVQFKVKVNAVKSAKLPELNDEFAAKLDVKDGSIETLQTEIKTSMERELKSALETLNKETVFDKFIEVNPIDVPTALVDQEIEAMRKELLSRFSGGQSMDKDKLPEFPRDMFEERATRRVTLGLLVREFIKANQLKVQEQEVNDRIKEIAQAYKEPEDVIGWYNSHRELRAEIEAMVMEDKVMEALMNDANVTVSELSYESVMQKNRDKKD